jgi:hypothetical protein
MTKIKKLLKKEEKNNCSFIFYTYFNVQTYLLNPSPPFIVRWGTHIVRNTLQRKMCIYCRSNLPQLWIGGNDVP